MVSRSTCWSPLWPCYTVYLYRYTGIIHNNKINNTWISALEKKQRILLAEFCAIGDNDKSIYYNRDYQFL